MSFDPHQPIKANQALNKKPKAGGGLSEDVFAPILIILMLALCAWALGVPIQWCIGFFLWAGAGWLLFAGSTPHIHLARLFKKTPNLFTARLNYQSREDIPLRRDRNDYY